MSVDSDRVAELFERQGKRPGGAAHKLIPVSSVGHRYVTQYAPPMPESFWGKVTYAFQNGQLVNISVEETLRP